MIRYLLYAGADVTMEASAGTQQNGLRPIDLIARNPALPLSQQAVNTFTRWDSGRF